MVNIFAPMGNMCWMSRDCATPWPFFFSVWYRSCFWGSPIPLPSTAGGRGDTGVSCLFMPIGMYNYIHQGYPLAVVFFLFLTLDCSGLSINTEHPKLFRGNLLFPSIHVPLDCVSRGFFLFPLPSPVAGFFEKDRGRWTHSTVPPLIFVFLIVFSNLVVV